MGKGIEAKHLNDDRRGRALDDCYRYGVTNLFTTVALSAAKKFGVETQRVHLDSSSLAVEGQYLADTQTSKSEGTTEEPVPIQITYGYSRDRRPDLKQFMIDTICSGDGDVPLYLRVADGNEADAVGFGKVVAQYRQQWQFDGMLVADAALYVVMRANHAGRGRPTANSVPQSLSYHLQAVLVENSTAIEQQQRIAGRFILATNELECKSLSGVEVLAEYKQQQASERGFRFLKDPLFFTSSVFLKSRQRIMAVAMVMALCLLVYTLAQRKLRQALSAADSSIPNQLGKLTATPTMRWVFQCFQSIHLIVVAGHQQISHLTPVRCRILEFLGSSCGRYYLLD